MSESQSGNQLNEAEAGRTPGNSSNNNNMALLPWPTVHNNPGENNNVPKSDHHNQNDPPNSPSAAAVDTTAGDCVGIQIQMNHGESPALHHPSTISEEEGEGRGYVINDRLEYQKDYPIKRFGRRWRRSDVLGICSLTLEITCLITLGIISLHGLGYMGEKPKLGYLPYSFSAKLLREFFTYEETPPHLVQCYHGFPTSPPAISENTNLGRYYNSDGEFDVEDPSTMTSDEMSLTEANSFRARKRCTKVDQQRPGEWVKKFIAGNFLAVLATITAGMFLLSLTVRRRKGLQVVLMLPTFLSFFISMFQQIPITFHYTYVNLVLKDDLRNAMSYSASGHYKSVPLLDQTQINMQCCGMDSPDSWELLGNFNGSYPGSCCNTIDFDCFGERFIPKNQTWTEGCYQKEYDRIRFFERWALLLLGLKILAELGLFYTVSDLTRFAYPPPAAQENSRCEFRGYSIRTRGIARIKGVTKDGRIVVHVRSFLPFMLTVRRVELVDGSMWEVRSEFYMNLVKGTIEIRRENNENNFRPRDIKIDRRRMNRGIYVFRLLL